MSALCAILIFLTLPASFWRAPIQQEPVTAPSPTAEGWQYLIRDSRGKDYYYLRSSNRFYSDVWFKTNGEITNDIEISLVRYNCESGADRLIQISSFRGNVLVSSYVYKDSEWQYAYPETIGAAKLRAACGESKREWTYIGSSDNNEAHFLKLDSLARSANLVRVWSQAVKNEIRQSVTLYQFDCINDRIRTLQSTSYIDGAVSSSTGLSTWSYVVPNSVGEMLAKRACRLKPPPAKQRPTRLPK